MEKKNNLIMIRLDDKTYIKLHGLAVKQNLPIATLARTIVYDTISRA